jgi:hypothetical protein
MTESNAPQEDAPQELTPTSDEIIAKPDARYRFKHLAFSIIIFGVGFWFAYDGWIGWPKHNQEVAVLQRDIDAAAKRNDQKTLDELKTRLAGMHKPYTEVDILIQKLLAVGLPIIGIAYGAWTLVATRGRIRLSGRTLEVPGAEPIEFVDIRHIDKSRWDRKGIAIIHYQAHHPQRERAYKLDDFAYNRKPTDEILERIEHFLAPPPELPPEPESEAAPQTDGPHGFPIDSEPPRDESVSR